MTTIAMLEEFSFRTTMIVESDECDKASTLDALHFAGRIIQQVLSEAQADEERHIAALTAYEKEISELRATIDGFMDSLQDLVPSRGTA